MPLASCDTQSEALRDMGSVPSTEDAGGGGLLTKISKPPFLLISFHVAGRMGGGSKDVLSWKLNTLCFPKGL